MFFFFPRKVSFFLFFLSKKKYPRPFSFHRFKTAVPDSFDISILVSVLEIQKKQQKIITQPLISSTPVCTRVSHRSINVLFVSVSRVSILHSKSSEEE